MVITTTRQEIKEVLMDSQASGVKEAYFTIPEEDHAIVVVSPGKNGTEFNKTFGVFHQYQGVLLLQCLYGQGIVVMQRNDEDDNAKEFKVVTIHPGKQAAIPAGFRHCLINIGKTFLVVLNPQAVSSGNNQDGKKTKLDQSFREKRGFAYYIVEKKGEVGFEQNPNYSVHPQISTE